MKIKSPEDILILESIKYWQHEYYQDATENLLGGFKECVIKAMKEYASQFIEKGAEIAVEERLNPFKIVKYKEQLKQLNK